MTKEKAWRIFKSQFIKHPLTRDQKLAYDVVDEVMRYEIIKEKKHMEIEKKIKKLIDEG